MLSREKIKTKLNELMLAAGNSDISNCSDSVRLKEDLGMTSVAMLYLVISLEEIFNVSFDDQSITSFPTLGSLIDFLERGGK